VGAAGAQFTCFTGTKYLIYSYKIKASEAWEQQMLSLLALLVQKYLIFFYKIKASEAWEEQVLSLLALLVQKYKY
jgi:hypothetical protein